MPKKRASPGVGRDETSNGPSPEDIREALALEITDQEMMRALRERRKQHRKDAEGKLVVLADLDELYKHRDDEPDDIEAWFRRRWRAFGAVFSELTQMDLFVRKSDGPQKATYAHQGMMIGLQGKACEAPDGLVGEDLQSFMGGFHDGNAARLKSQKTLADHIAAAIRITESGGVVDGTGDTVKAVEQKTPKAKLSKKAQAEAVRLQAQADFEADADKRTVAGITYLTDEGADEARAKIAAMRSGGDAPAFGPTEDEKAFD